MIDLEWAVASQYVLRPGPTGDLTIYPAEGARLVRYWPLEQYPALYAELAKLDGSKEACLQFAHRYGLLFTDLSGPPKTWNDQCGPETLVQWQGHIKDLREIIHRCDLSRADPAEAFRQFGKEDVPLFGVDLYLSIKSRRSPATLELRSPVLLNAIKLQAVESILGGRKSFQCIECTTWIEIGNGARRSQSKFCSTRCKDSYHNRLKAQSRRARHA